MMKKAKLMRLVATRGITVRNTRFRWVTVPVGTEFVGVEQTLVNRIGRSAYGWHAIFFNRETSDGEPCWIPETSIGSLATIENVQGSHDVIMFGDDNNAESANATVSLNDEVHTVSCTCAKCEEFWACCPTYRCNTCD